MVRRFRARCHALWTWHSKESDLDEEIRFHLAEEADERVSDGTAPEEAIAGARRDFGNVLLVREATREAWGWGVAERLAQDYRYALRSMRRDPGFSAAVVLALAVGTGANTAIFTVVNSLLLRPLPVEEPERLALVAATHPETPQGQPRFGWSFAMWTQIRQRPQLFDGAFAARGRETFVNRVGPGWFGVYGMRMLGGRDFTEADNGRSKRVVIVNQAFAREFLNGQDPLGRFVTQVHAPPGQPPVASEIVGVTTDAVYESLRASVPATMYLPFDQIGAELLSAGAAPESASLSVRTAIAPSPVLTRSLAAAIAQVNPGLDLTFRTMPDIVSRSISVERALAILSGLFGAVSLLLAAIGLYGVTSYAVGRRRSEIGIRMALGATRAVILRQIVTRVLVLVAAGVLGGVGASLWASQLVSALLHAVDPGDPVTLIGGVVLLTGIGALAGLVPAWRASRVDPIVALRYE